MSDAAARGGDSRVRRSLWCGGVVSASLVLLGVTVPAAPVAVTMVQVDPSVPWDRRDVALAVARAVQAANEASGDVRVSVEALDQRVLRIAVQGADQASARAASLKAAERIVEGAAWIFARPAPVELTQAETDVASFVSSNVLALVRAPEAPVRPARPEGEKIRLEIERKRVVAQLAQIESQEPSGQTSDDPFADPVRHGDPRLLRRRLIEIDRLLGVAKSADASVVDRTPHVELGRLLERVRLERSVPSASPPTSARVLGDTALARQPPPWGRLFGFASLAGLVTAVVPLARRRRGRLSPVGVPDAPAPTRAEDPRVEFTWEPLAAPAPAEQVASFVPSDVVTAPTAPSVTRHSSHPPAASPVMAYPVEVRSKVEVSESTHRELCAKLRELGSADGLVCVVTSAASDAGAKSKLALELALALALAPDARILAVDANLGDPSLHTLLALHVPADVDFSRQLAARVESKSDGHWYVFKCSPSLHVLCSDVAAADLVLTTHFEEAIRQLRHYYDIIVLLGPSLNETIQCQALNDVTDAVIVARLAGKPPADLPLGAFSGKAFSSTVWIS